MRKDIDGSLIREEFTLGLGLGLGLDIDGSLIREEFHLKPETYP